VRIYSIIHIIDFSRTEWGMGRLRWLTHSLQPAVYDALLLQTTCFKYCYLVITDDFPEPAVDNVDNRCCFLPGVRWISHDVTQRKRYVFELLKHVRLPLLSVCLLEKTISECTDTSLKVIGYMIECENIRKLAACSSPYNCWKINHFF
jgi:hypothetical protein